MTGANNGASSNNAGNVIKRKPASFYRNKGFETRAIQAGQDPDQWSSGIVIPPIYTGTTFKSDAPGTNRGYEFGRSGTPTRSSLETCIASLENSKHAFAVSAGLATVTGVCALLKVGDHVICGNSIFGGTFSNFRIIGKSHGLQVEFIDTTNIDLIEKTIKPNTKMVFVESSTNPDLKIMDLPSIAAVLKAKNQGILLVVDNTILTPYYQKPLELGADIAVYSMTKYMNGHTDVIMGAITTNDDAIAKRIAFIETIMGFIPSPFDSYLANRGLKTLAIRMDRHTHNATEIAKFLEKHPSVEKVIYPGLKSHPQYELAKRMCKGASGMVSFYIKGDLKTSTAFLKALNIFVLAGSLGCLESLVEIPSILSHSSIPEDVKKELGITDNLIRVSVGLETAEDLIEDLDQALKIATGAS